MSQDKQPSSRRSGRGRLPRSGLADDVLGTEDADPGSEPGPAVAEEEAGEPEPVTGPDRIFEFADSLDDGPGEVVEKKVEEHETWVSFELAGQLFALPVSHVQEILRVTVITPVPHAPNPIRGVTNKRGQVLPVVDLRLRLGLPGASVGDRSRILVVEARRRQLGLLVDGVHQVLRLARSQVQPPPPDVMTEQSDYIIGVYHLEETLAILLDVDRVLVVRDSASDGARPAEQPEARA